MKKLLTIFAFVALLTGCDELYGPNPVKKDAVSSKGLTITVNTASIGDTGFTAEIVPAEKDVFSSFVLCKGDEPSELDPDAVLKCTVAGEKCSTLTKIYNTAGDEIDSKSATSAKGTFQADKAVITFAGLEQNTTYQLYAVAASSTGVAGEVFSVAVLTTDSRSPKQTEAGSIDSEVATIVFSQPVSFVSGSEVKVSVFAAYTQAFFRAQSVDSYVLSDEDIVVSEDGMSVDISYHPENIPSGAYFTVNYPDGAFISDTKVPCAGCSAAYTYASDGQTVIAVDASGAALTVFNGSRIDPVTFEMAAPEDAEVFDPIPVEWIFDQNDEIALIALYDTDATIAYSYGDDSKKVNLILKYGTGWDYVLDESYAISGISVYLPELPETPGESLTLEVPADILVDEFGNTNEAVKWSAKFMQLDEIGTGLFSELEFLGTENAECTLFYNPSSDVYRIADCFVPGYNLEFTWDKATNKCEIIGMQKTGYTMGGVDIYVEDAKTYWMDNYSWEVLEANGFKQPYYEDGMFVFPNVAYELPATGQYTDPMFTITFNMGRDITEPQLEGIWSCTSVTDYWGDTYGPFNVAIQQAVDEAGAPVENVYSIINLAPYLATMGVTARTFGTWDAENSQLVIAYDQPSGISAGGTPLTYKGFDNVDPDAAEYSDNVYFSVSAVPAAMVNLNAYGILAGSSPYEMYYGGTMQLKRTADLPATTSNCVEASEAQLKAMSSKATKVNALGISEGSFLKKGKAVFLQSASKERKLK